jgi:PTH1 family peptidyl-tRNA hydrolase
MQLIVGLGNPGSEHKNNRHNLGFMTLDKINTKFQVGKWKNKYQSEVAAGTIASHKVLLLKPLTYMNNSGQAVRKALDFYKLDIKKTIVFFDEIELAPGKVRVKKGGGHAGHNGIRNIIDHNGEDFWRVRIGVGHPGSKDKVSQYVLNNFSHEDQTWLSELLTALTVYTPELLKGDSNLFMTAIATVMNLTTTPPSPRENFHQQNRG